MIALAFLIDGAFGVPQDSLSNLDHGSSFHVREIRWVADDASVFAGYMAYSIENQVW